ncbi:MAG: hypothetical protein L0241_22060 [Planctomycetia bacterium]|nr:hypothetical protein [Planctomycetia bacterium]
MAVKPPVLKGVVRGGVVVLESSAALPEGTEVQVTVAPIPFTPEEQAEFAGWEKLGDEAWAMIDEWEKEDARRATG